jgi:threonine dehydratase
VSAAVTLETIRDAAARLAPLFGPTPTLAVPAFSARAGREVLLKAENLQRTGSFKVRGAYNKISRLAEARACTGVVCASAGNHAQGVALAAKMSALPAVIVMPEETPLIKVVRTRAYGAEVVLQGEGYEDAFRAALEIGRARGYTFVHAFEDPEVMAGQGTIGLEILDQAPDVEAVVVPVGGGGLISGIATAIKAIRPEVAVYGVQAAGAAPAAASLRAGKAVSLPAAETIADAIRMKTVSAVTFPILQRLVDGVVPVEDEEIADAVVKLVEEAKLVVEGAGAAGLAALLAGRLPPGRGRIVVVLSGGNVDLNLIARVVEQGLSREGRYLVIRTRVPDRPGRLLKILAHLASRKVNVFDVVHHRAGWRIPLGQVEIELLVETRDAAHAAEIVADLTAAGYMVERGEAGRAAR